MNENDYNDESFKRAEAWWNQAPGETQREKGAWHLGILSAERQVLRQRQDVLRQAVVEGFDHVKAMRAFNVLRRHERIINAYIVEVQRIGQILLCDLEAWDQENPEGEE